MLGINNPRIGLLSNGEEEGKGNEQVRLATELFVKSGLNFVGNVEGRDVFSGEADVVVCEGFVGNVLLKVSEGMAETILSMMKEAIQRTLRPMRYLSARSPLIERAMSGKHHDGKVDPLSLHKLIVWVDILCPYLGEAEIRALSDGNVTGRRGIYAGRSVRLGRTAWLQIVKGDHYYAMAEGNRLRVERLEPKRGIIYDRALRPLVRNQANFLLYVVPADLPEAPDATFIGVNRFATIDVVAELRAMGAGGAICFASGWTEEQLLENYPALSRDALRAVFAFAAESLADESIHPSKRKTG